MEYIFLALMVGMAGSMLAIILWGAWYHIIHFLMKIVDGSPLNHSERKWLNNWACGFSAATYALIIVLTLNVIP